MRQLKGKVAVVTGASRRIGAATAKRLAQHGAAVAVLFLASGEARFITGAHLPGSGGIQMP